MASQVIQGLQSQGVSATIKHFVANEQETSRTSVNETISERALREIYLRPFEIAIKEANPWCLMTAYNLVNGTHCDSHTWLLRDVLRGEWKWDGLVMSDWGGTNSVTEALEAGLDLEMPGPPKVRKLETILAKIQDGSISERDIDARARTVLSLALKLDALRKTAAPVKDDIAETGSFIRQAGARGMVLLKNEDQILPLSKEKIQGKTVALIGYAKDALAHGGGSASVNAYYKVTPEEGLKAAFKDDDVKFLYAKGAHKERLLPALSRDSTVGAVTDLEGNPGFSLFIREKDTDNLAATRHGYHTSSYSPLGSNESYQRNVELVADFTPLETGSHYFACSGLGPTRVLIDDKLVFEQKNNTEDPMGSLFNAAPEPEFQFGFIAGQKYRIRICTDPPINIGLQILEGRSGVRLGFSPQSVHDANLKLEAVRVAIDADYAIIFTGHDPQWETEGQDQSSFHLPHDQDGLISAVAAVNKNVIVVNSTGVAVAMPWVNQVKGLIQAWFPGQECGNAIADIITGSINPEGHLPFTIPHCIEDAPAHGNFPGAMKGGRLEVSYKEDIFVGYRHYDRISQDKVNFPFGHGLSYTNFEYGDMELQHVSATTFSVKVSVTNIGSMAGGVLVQLYAGKADRSDNHPIKTLVGFKKMKLNAGQRCAVEIVVNITDLAHFDDGNKKWIVETGDYDISLGASAADILKSVKLSIPGSSRVV
jgi:beta-glucosidase